MSRFKLVNTCHVSVQGSDGRLSSGFRVLGFGGFKAVGFSSMKPCTQNRPESSTKRRRDLKGDL